MGKKVQQIAIADLSTFTITIYSHSADQPLVPVREDRTKFDRYLPRNLLGCGWPIFTATNDRMYFIQDEEVNEGSKDPPL